MVEPPLEQPNKLRNETCFFNIQHVVSIYHNTYEFAHHKLVYTLAMYILKTPLKNLCYLPTKSPHSSAEDGWCIARLLSASAGLFLLRSTQ